MESNVCVEGATCHNFHGAYNCSCPEGNEGDGKINGTGCRPKFNSNSGAYVILIIALSEYTYQNRKSFFAPTRFIILLI